MKNKVVKRVLTVILAVVVLGLAFTAGFFTRLWTQGKYLSSYEWFLKTIEENYYYGGVEDSFNVTGMKEIADVYLDKYSEYYTAEEYAQIELSNQGSKSGLGISYSYVAGKGIYISSVICNSPAYICGLRAGEWLESGYLEGKEEVVFNSSSDFQNLVNSAKENEKLNFTSTDGNKYTASRSDYTASYVYLCTNSTAWIFGDSADGGLALYETPSERISCLPDGTGYIRLTQFYGSAVSEFYKIIEKFNAEHCTSLILDLRSNGGGSVSVMQGIAGCFAGGSTKPAMYSRGKSGSTVLYNCLKVSNPDRLVPADTKVYVLANSGTASASEALIGAMVVYGVLDYKNIFLSQYSEEYMNWLKDTNQELKTERTYGKGIMQTTFRNQSTGEALKLTTAEIYWPDGETCIHDRGLTLADGCTAVYAEWQHTKQDNELKTVAEIIKSR